MQFSAFKVTFSRLTWACIVIPVLDWLKFGEQVASLVGIGQNRKKYPSDLNVHQLVLEDLNSNNTDRSTIF